MIRTKEEGETGDSSINRYWYEKSTDVDHVIPVSAKYGRGFDDVKDQDITSEHPKGFFIAEIVTR